MTSRHYFAIENRILNCGDKSYILDVCRLHFYSCPPGAARVLSVCDGSTLETIVEIVHRDREEVSRQLDELVQLGLVSDQPQPAPGCVETDPLKVPISSLAIQVDDPQAQRTLTLDLARQAFHLWMSHPAHTPDLSLTLWVHCPDKCSFEITQIVETARRLARGYGLRLRILIQTGACPSRPDLGGEVEWLYDLDDALARPAFPECLDQLLARLQSDRRPTIGCMTLSPAAGEARLGCMLSALREAGVTGFYFLTPAGSESGWTADWIYNALAHLDPKIQNQWLNIGNILFPVYRLVNAQPVWYGCQAGRGHLALSVEGNFYPCQCFIGRREFEMGDSRRGIAQAQRAVYLQAHVDGRPGCRGCWARYLCGGGCLREALAVSRDLSQPYAAHCEMIYKLAERTVYGFQDRLRVIAELYYRSLKPFLPHVVAPSGSPAGSAPTWILARGDSMWPTIRNGERVQVEPISVDHPTVGDVVLFEQNGETIIHRLIGQIFCEEKLNFLEKGDNTDRVHLLSPACLLGRVVAVERDRALIPITRATAAERLKENAVDDRS